MTRRSVSPKGGEEKSQSGSIRIMHTHAAGIDIGSRIHYVAVGADHDKEPVRSFGCLTPDMHEMARWLKACQVETIAMESTGVYWIPVMQVLESYGFEVFLVDARQAKNMPGRKTDVKDCQWIQELHTYGLLTRAFRPVQEMCVLRSYWRHRRNLVELTSMQIQWMQKSLEQMNLQLHKVLSDITGLTGMKIIRGIVGGQRDPMVLARMRHPRVRSSEETIVKALTGDWREEHLFTLGQALELYDFYQQKIEECDRRIEGYMKGLGKGGEVKPEEKVGSVKAHKKGVSFDLGSHLRALTGVDLTQIDGIDASTAQTVISEGGYDMSRFATEKHYSSWLGLCPNHQITGGKVRRRRTRKVGNRAAVALRLAAQSLCRSRTSLGSFYRRIKSRHCAAKAATATAHKLAVLIYRMLKYGMAYVDQGQEVYERQYNEGLMKRLAKQARQMGYQMVSLGTGEVVS